MISTAVRFVSDFLKLMWQISGPIMLISRKLFHRIKCDLTIQLRFRLECFAKFTPRNNKRLFAKGKFDNAWLFALNDTYSPPLFNPSLKEYSYPSDAVNPRLYVLMNAWGNTTYWKKKSLSSFCDRDSKRRSTLVRSLNPSQGRGMRVLSSRCP